MTGPKPDRDLYVLGDPSAHLGFLNCERIAERSHIHGWSVESHYHEGLAQLFMFNAGQVSSRIDDVPREIEGSALVWLPALCSHAFDYQVGMEGWVITVPTTDIARIASKFIWIESWINRPQLLTGIKHQICLSEALEIVRRIETEQARQSVESNLALESLFQLLLISLNRGLAVERGREENFPNRKQRLINRFQSLLEQNRGTARSVSDYASMLSITSTHLTRTVKSVTGKTAGEIIDDRVLMEAKRKLVFSDLPIAEIAYLLGFSSPSYFTRFFSAHGGQSPRSFRQEMRKGFKPSPPQDI